MVQQRRVVWGFYPGIHSTGTDFGSTDVFRSKRLVAVGWPLIENLQTFVTERRPVADFKERVRFDYEDRLRAEGMESDAREQWLLRSARVLHRFLIEAQPGDLVVYACKRNEQVYTGQFQDTDEGRYKYDATLHDDCCHFRAVKWLETTPYSDCARAELNQVRTQNIFWRMRTCPVKFLAVP